MAKHRTTRRRTGKGDKGLLVRAYLENAPRWLLETKTPKRLFARIDEEFRETLRHKSGVYALYKGEKIYYIGLTKGLYWRLRGHARGKHRKHWDHFSVWVVHRFRYVKDLETMLLRLVGPPGNSVKGHFPRKFNLKPRINGLIAKERGQWW